MPLDVEVLVARTGNKTHVIADVLDKLERATREIGRSLDPMRGSLDYDRLVRARETLGVALEDLDAVLAERT